MKVLAIDPGYGRIGFAVAKKENKQVELIFSECFETPKNTPFEKKLLLVGERQREHIEKHKPDTVVIEQLFFAKNKKTALQTAEVRGVCIYVAKKESTEIVEYTPNQIKSAVTGNGNASKEDIARMIPLLIKLSKKEKRIDDEYDAIAIAITHLETPKNPYTNIL